MTSTTESTVVVGDAVGPYETTPDIVTLFEYSAACWLPHRIHYDLAYALSEGHTGIVIHGPLQGTLLLNVAGRWAAERGGRLVKSSYRHSSSAVIGDTLVISGQVTGVASDEFGRDVTVDIAVAVKDEGRVTTAGSVTIRIEA